MVHVTFLRTADEIGFRNQIRRRYRELAETQVAHGDAARFFAVVSEISLRVKVGVVADNFNCGLVRADCAIRAETPEFARGGTFGRQVNVVISNGQRLVRHVVVDTDCKAVERRIFFEFVEDRKHLFGPCRRDRNVRRRQRA